MRKSLNSSNLATNSYISLCVFDFHVAGFANTCKIGHFKGLANTWLPNKDLFYLFKYAFHFHLSQLTHFVYYSVFRNTLLEMVSHLKPKVALVHQVSVTLSNFQCCFSYSGICPDYVLRLTLLQRFVKSFCTCVCLYFC